MRGHKTGMATGSATTRGRGQAQRAANSTAVSAGARAGFVARGVIYVLIGVLSLRIAFSDGGGKQADRGGAIAEIADQPFGTVLLWLLGIALAGMALWRLSEAAFGQAGPYGKKAGKRVMAVGRSVFYAFVSCSVLFYAAGDKGSGSGSSDKNSQDVTAKALDWPAGQWIVAVVEASRWAQPVCGSRCGRSCASSISISRCLRCRHTPVRWLISLGCSEVPPGVLSSLSRAASPSRPLFSTSLVRPKAWTTHCAHSARRPRAPGCWR